MAFSITSHPRRVPQVRGTMNTQTVAARTERLPAATGVASAIVAASCCLLPIALIALGIAGAGFMMTMMQHEWITLPLGVLGLAGAYAFYFRGRRRCETAGCQFVGKRVNQALLALATVIVAIAVLLRVVPSWTARFIEQL